MKSRILIIGILLFVAFSAKSEDVTFAGVTLTTNAASAELNLVQGQALNITTVTTWFLDPDYINTDGSFAAISGKYKITADFGLRYFRVFPMSGNDLAILNDDCTGTIWVNGDGFGKPSLNNNANWWAGEPRTLAMSPVGNKHYQLTLTAGQTIRTGTSLNMRFNKQIISTIDGNISPNLLLQGIGSDIVFKNTGDGSQLYFNNNVDIPTGTKLVFTIDLSNGLNNATLTIDRSNVSIFGTAMTKIDNNNFRFEGNITNGAPANITGIFDLQNWYLDPDYFTPEGNFNAQTGKYRVTADFNLKYFRVAPMIGNDLATFTGTVWVCGQGVGKPSAVTNNADCFAGENKSLAMSPIGNSQYRLTLVAGQTLSVDNINIRFNGDLTSNSNLCNSLTLVGTEINNLVQKDTAVVLKEGVLFEYGASYTFILNASANTLSLSKTTNAANNLDIHVFGKQLYRVSENEYNFSGIITNGTAANVSGIDDIANWWLDPDYFDTNGNFDAATGEYKITADFRLKYFRIIPLVNGQIGYLQADGSGTVWVIGGNALGKPSITKNESSWNFADGTKALAMTPIGDKHYRLTLYAPQTVNAALNNLIFYKSLTNPQTISNDITLAGDFTNEIYFKNLADGNHIYFKNGKGLDFGEKYIFTMDLSNGIENATFSVEHIPSGLSPSNDPHFYQHFILYGQSLSVGYDSWMSLSTENVKGNYMIGDQVWIQPHLGATNFSEFKPLIATAAQADNLVAECPVTSTANYIRKRQESEAPNVENRFIATSCGVGGTSIEQLSKSYAEKWLYYNFYQSLVQGKKLANLSGSNIECPAIFWMQGESDYDYSTAQATYKQRFVQLKNDMQNDVQAVYGQSTKPLFISYEVGHQWAKNPLTITMAQLEATNENEDMVCAGPVYPMTDWGGHLDANGTRWFGEMLGKVYWETQILGKKFYPLQPQQLMRNPDNLKQVIVKFHVPHLPLTFDEKTLKKVRNYGFEVYNDNVVQSISNFSINGDTVVLTCANNLTGKIDVVYAGENVDYISGSGGKGHGNLRDSDTATGYFDYINPNLKDGNGKYIYPHYNNNLSSYTPASGEPKDVSGNVIYNRKYPLYNFCVAFFYTIPAGDDDYKVMSVFNLQDGEELSVHSPHINNPIKVFPNPVKDVLRIKFPENKKINSIEIYNVEGKMFYKKPYFEDTINVSSFPAGIYILKINTANEQFFVSKFVKE
ncbi:MAG: DUF5121 domain-containing protein [Bacteroidales bacterium]|jgi:hypothetical protein|nr:DUF5121 domain-containing protein [Bacteroidales bacterium]